MWNLAISIDALHVSAGQMQRAERHDCLGQERFTLVGRARGQEAGRLRKVR